MSTALKDIASQLVELAKQSGASHADALSILDLGESVQVRHGALESIEREDSRGVGLRAFVETSQGFAFASASSSDVSPEGLKALVQQVIAMAKISEPDPDAVPPEGADHPTLEAMQAWSEKHPHQAHGWNTQAAQEAALQCEQAALQYSDAISNSEGAHASFGETAIAYAASDQFSSDYQRASSSLSLSVIAGEGEKMQRDYAYTRARQACDLRAPEEVGVEASERTLRMLGASGLSSRTSSVIFEPRVATSILRHFASAINGRSVVQKHSFLMDALNQSVFPEFVHISDDPDHPDGMGNRLFDGEGTHCQARNIIESGRLTSFLTDRYAARRLNTQSTGHARRGLAGDIGIGTSNFILHGGDLNQEAMLYEMGDGLLITELMGFGVNSVTGDYSRGAAGFLVEKGQIVRPVQGITLASNLKDMFANMFCLGSDLTWFGSMATPSIGIKNMTVAGE